MPRTFYHTNDCTTDERTWLGDQKPVDERDEDLPTFLMRPSTTEACKRQAAMREADPKLPPGLPANYNATLRRSAPENEGHISGLLLVFLVALVLGYWLARLAS